MDMKIPGSREILEFHDSWLAQPDWGAESPAAQAQGVWSHIEHNHRCNCRLWKEEDQARRRNVPDSAIAANKRNIDAFNQQRNDSIEKIDECLLAQLAEVELNAAVRLHSESAGSMIDRLSILALKVFHMRTQTERSDATRLQLYLRLLRYVKPYWAPFALSIAAMVVTALTEPVFPALLKPLLDGSFVHKEGGLLVWLPALIVAVFLVRGFASYLSDY